MIEEYKEIAISKDLHKRILEDRDHFQKTIGGGQWSINDTLNEYIKILDVVKQKVSGD